LEATAVTEEKPDNTEGELEDDGIKKETDIDPDDDTAAEPDPSNDAIKTEDDKSTDLASPGKKSATVTFSLSSHFTK